MEALIGGRVHPFSRNLVLDREVNMKKIKTAEKIFSLGDLILAVSSSSSSKEETAAAIADLLASGKVRILNSCGALVRARVQ
jgi:hypothetical protein